MIQTQIIGLEAIRVVLIYESPRQYTKCAINRNTNTEYARTDRLYTHIRTCLEVFETLECYLELKGVEKRRRVIQDCNVCNLYFSHTAIALHRTFGGKFRVSAPSLFCACSDVIASPLRNNIEPKALVWYMLGH